MALRWQMETPPNGRCENRMTLAVDAGELPNGLVARCTICVKPAEAEDVCCCNCYYVADELLSSASSCTSLTNCGLTPSYRMLVSTPSTDRICPEYLTSSSDDLGDIYCQWTSVAGIAGQKILLNVYSPESRLAKLYVPVPESSASSATVFFRTYICSDWSCNGGTFADYVPASSSSYVACRSQLPSTITVTAVQCTYSGSGCSDSSASSSSSSASSTCAGDCTWLIYRDASSTIYQYLLLNQTCYGFDISCGCWYPMPALLSSTSWSDTYTTPCDHGLLCIGTCRYRGVIVPIGESTGCVGVTCISDLESVRWEFNTIDYGGSASSCSNCFCPSPFTCNFYNLYGCPTLDDTMDVVCGFPAGAG